MRNCAAQQTECFCFWLLLILLWGEKGQSQGRFLLCSFQYHLERKIETIFGIIEGIK